MARITVYKPQTQTNLAKTPYVEPLKNKEKIPVLVYQGDLSSGGGTLVYTVPKGYDLTIQTLTITSYNVLAPGTTGSVLVYLDGGVDFLVNNRFNDTYFPSLAISYPFGFKLKEGRSIYLRAVTNDAGMVLNGWIESNSN